MRVWRLSVHMRVAFWVCALRMAFEMNPHGFGQVALWILFMAEVGCWNTCYIPTYGLNVIRCTAELINEVGRCVVSCVLMFASC